jgi:transposase
LGAGQVDRPPVLVMVAGYSRLIAGRMLPTRTAEDLLAGMWTLLESWGATPRTLVWDGEGAIGSWKSGRPLLTPATQAFRGVLGVAVTLCRPADPEAKGLVERANGYLETSFLPGRRFASPADFNAQLAEWTATVNGRVRRALGCAPADRISADRHAMLSVPPVTPETGWRASLRLPRDHYVRLDANDYSVHPAVIGRRVDVVADLDRVRVFCAGRSVATHERCWAHGQTITDPAHRDAAQALRKAHRSMPRPRSETEVQQRNLADYDRIVGVEVAA